MPVTLADDAIDGGESQAGPFADLLGGEKRLKNAGARGFVHSAAGVLDRQERIIHGARLKIDATRIHIQQGIAGSDGQLPPLRHGVARIDGQVQEHLLDLAGIGLHQPKIGGQIGDKIDVFADKASEHLLEVGDEIIEVEDLRSQQLFAAEGQELAR